MKVVCYSGHPVADPEGGGRGFKPPFRGFLFFFACQHMKIPTDLDPTPPPFEEFWPRTPPPPLKEFLDPPLHPFRVGGWVGGWVVGWVGGWAGEWVGGWVVGWVSEWVGGWAGGLRILRILLCAQCAHLWIPIMSSFLLGSNQQKDGYWHWFTPGIPWQ